MPHSGTCLCGRCKIHLTSTHHEQIICHCWDCKRNTGSAFSANVLAPTSEVEIEGPTKTYDFVAHTGNPVSVIFCDICGTCLSRKSDTFGEYQAVQTGIFKDFAGVPITSELFVDERWLGLPAIGGAHQCRALHELNELSSRQ
ncbi:hypothetical protein CVT26_007315 [Gymnopilus dilepis]|uniref:CENP-V/GFA domain-containing protein n=1 Tax=Gymnopilus dilepis TaxID=231916 RepID=A0A409W1E1_9AGAR|nr:hypothetical protein CVT26_007315 [Gymnopilus dilepis]